jgi:SAM-dependent methyltransferase
LDLAQGIAPLGRIVGVDLDEENLESARAEAQDRGIQNIEFRTAAADGPLGEAVFDLVYARYLLTHLGDPAACIGRMCTALKPGGLLVVEDCDMSGCFSYPESPAYRRFVELYTELVRRRGADANIGPRLPLLLLEAGLEHVDMHVVQPAGLTGEVKLLMPMSMESTADAILTNALATREEITQIVVSLYEFAREARTVFGLPRTVQAWGRRSCNDFRRGGS